MIRLLVWMVLPSFLIEAFRQPAAATRYDQLFMRVGARRLGFGGCKLELRSKHGGGVCCVGCLRYVLWHLECKERNSCIRASLAYAPLAYALLLHQRPLQAQLLHTHLLHTRYSCTSVHCKSKSCIRATCKAPMRIQWSASGFRKSSKA